MMRYITIDDMTTVIQNRLLLESVEKDTELLESIEDMAISEAAAYMGGRYDTGKIFSETPVRTGILVRVIACMVVTRSVRRNAARKVPDSLQELEDWAMSILVKIRDGIMPLPAEIPPLTDEDGKPDTPLLYGHTRNEGWYF